MRTLAIILLTTTSAILPSATALTAQPLSSPVSSSEPFVSPRVIFDKASAYGRVLVVEIGRERLLRFGDMNGVDQSAMSLDDPHSVPMEYVRFAGLALVFAPEVKNVLMIGLGGGSFTGMLHRALPEARIAAIEIDPVVVEAAKSFFGLVEDDKYRVHIADGAAFVESSKTHYDIILADAGVADGIPDQHTSDPFFVSLRNHLTAGGVLVVNLGLDDRQNARIADRIKAAFGADACLSVRTPHDANTLVFATRRSPGPHTKQLRLRATAFDKQHRLPFALAPLADILARCP